MKLELENRLGYKKRIGLVIGDNTIVDLHTAYAYMLAEKDKHPKPQAVADVLLPPDMLAFIQSDTLGIKAVYRFSIGVKQCHDPGLIKFHQRSVNALLRLPQKNSHNTALNCLR